MMDKVTDKTIDEVPKIRHTTDDTAIKTFASKHYNMTYNKVSGEFKRWGATPEDDPVWCEFGPEILDIEVSAGGDCMGNCPFCYKANGGNQRTHNMSLGEFEQILGCFRKDVLTQIAFGIMNISTNPDFFAMMKRAKELGIVPNYTTHGLDMTEEYAKKSAELCGVVCVSVIDREKTFDAVAMLRDAGQRQVNVHYMLSEETYPGAFSLMHEIANDPRTSDLHALTFLQYKAKGRGVGKYTTIQDVEKYRKLLARASELGLSIGFDSCSAPMYLKTLENTPGGKGMAKYVEPCESGLFSAYVNYKSELFPCSFMEGQPGWRYGIDISNYMFTAIWDNVRLSAWRKRLLESKSGVCTSCSYKDICRVCPEYAELRCADDKKGDFK